MEIHIHRGFSILEIGIIVFFIKYKNTSVGI